MTQNHEDLRVGRTKKMIQEALIDLVAERGFEAITVGDIAERAKVNRATFYRHYRDKYDLIEQLFEEAINDMIRSVGPPKLLSDNFSQIQTLKHMGQLFAHVDQHARLYEAMLGSHGNPWFAAQLRDRLAAKVLDRETRRPHAASGEPLPADPEGAEIAVMMVASFIVGTIGWWLDNKRRYPQEQIAAWLTGILSNGYVYTISHPPTFAHEPPPSDDVSEP